MRVSVSFACVAALVCGCATRPATGPGSGEGANYVPMVQMPSAEPDGYQDDVARCQASARSIPFKADEHDEPLFWLGTAVVGSAAWTGLGMYSVIATGWAGGAMAGFTTWVYTPQRAAWRKKQETAIANCMARKGYVNTDPSVTVTWLAPSQGSGSAPRVTGRDTYIAEKFAKAQSCNVAPLATLVEKGPGFETYNVPCSSGQVLTVRCEFGNCRPGQTVAARN